MEHRRQVSKAEIERARELDLLTYLQTYEPHELVRISSAVYSTRSHDSLKISNGKWYQWSTGIGGVSALDYLVKVQGMQIHHVAIYINGEFLIDSTGGNNSVQIRKHWGKNGSEWQWICFGRPTN